MSIGDVDIKIIRFFGRIADPFARFGIFVVYFWFGLLKVVGLSPASGVVGRLFEQTVAFMSFGHFIVLFGLFECVIGILFLVRGAERVVMPLLLIHLITTLGPLVLLPSETWAGLFVPTMEGQYIIKNVLIAAIAMGIVGKMRPINS